MEEFDKECLPKQTDMVYSEENICIVSQKSLDTVASHLNTDNDGTGCHVCFLSQLADGAKENVSNNRTESYHCGVCPQTFCTICCLHNHLTTYHLLSGSYHYDYFIQTAFPKHESLCQFTQTEDLDFNREGDFDVDEEKKTAGDSSAIQKRKIKIQSKKKCRTKSNAFYESNSVEKVLEEKKFKRITLRDVNEEKEDFIYNKNTENSDEIDDNFSDRTDDYFENGDNLSSDTVIEEVTSSGTVIPQETDHEKSVRTRKKMGIKRKLKANDSVSKNKSDQLKGLTRIKDCKLYSDTSNIRKIGENGASIKRARQKCSKKTKTGKNTVSVKQENHILLNDPVNSDTFVSSLLELPVSIPDSNEVSDKDGEDILSKKVSKTEENKCEVCGATFTVKQGLLRHEQHKHSDLMKFHCDQCKKKFMREFNLQKHVIRVHGGRKGNRTKIEDEGENIIDCKEELDTFDVKPETMQSNSFTDQEDHQDVVCGEQSETGEAKNQRRKRRTNEEMKTMKAPHTCELCGHTMPRSKMDVHQRLHTGERPFICTICGKGLISQNKLSRHMLIHGEVKRHTCEICGVGFHMKYKLRMHMHIHTGKKPYLCSICGAEFNHSANLATHTRCVHLQVKPYVCNVCGGKYSKRSQLDDHVLSHSTERQFTCRYCGKSFKYFKGMRRHEKSHTEEESFTCNQCGLKFARKENLDKHKISHGETSYQCKTCKKVLKDGRALQEHEFTHLVAKGCKCLVCGEMFYSSNKYFTHLFVVHSIQKQDAQLMIIEEKLKKDNKQAEKQQKVTLSSNLGTSTPITGQGVTFDVSVSEILENAGKDTMSVLTRVATENLRLHSQDVPVQDKATVIIPPLNPMIIYEKNRITSLENTTGTNGGFSLEHKVIGNTVADTLTFPDHAYGQSMKQVENHGNHVTTTIVMPHSDSSLQHQGINENVLGFVTSNALTSINNLTSYIGQRPTSLTPLTNLTTNLHQDEHGAIESLRQLQDNSLTQMTLVPSTVGMGVNQGQRNVGMTSAGSSEGGSQSNFRIQNLY